MVDRAARFQGVFFSIFSLPGEHRSSAVDPDSAHHCTRCTRGERFVLLDLQIVSAENPVANPDLRVIDVSGPRCCRR